QKSFKKSFLYGSQNFGTTDFLFGKAQNGANPDGFASILTTPQQKICVPKSGSSFKALATVESGLADSRKIQLECGVSRIFSLFRGNGKNLFFASSCGWYQHHHTLFISFFCGRGLFR
ncbi:MAG: hypothetical protein IJ333_04410, partial [Clostridia bacterium]|nr:hypothetical protein [Clostridia bacterium]